MRIRNTMSSKTYWRDRELEWKKKRLKDEKQYADEIQEIYANMMDSVEKEIESFFSRYANKENITMAEAKKRVSNIDIKEFQRKAKKYVKEKNFSDEANGQMRLYNLAMKVNRLELLKANIGLELVAGHDELKSYTGDKLEGAYLEEIKRNASILGDTVIDNAKMAKTVADSSFKNATFSERIWVNQDQLKNSLSSVLSNALIQGKNPREFIPIIRKKFDVSRCNAERLLRTEIARVQTQAQIESYESNGIDEYEYIACSLKDVCPLCKEMDGKVFKLKDMEIGENAPPRHPNCHCALAPHSDRKEYEKWLDGLANGEHSLRFDEWKEKQALHENKKGPITVITESAINRVPLMKLARLTEKEAKKLQAIHKRLLEESRVHNQSNEVGYKMTPDFKPKETKYGSDDKLIFSSVSISPKTYVAHNHPRNNSYSINDLLFFYENEDVQLLTIVKNNGNIELLDKANFDKGKFKTLVRRNIKKYTSNKGEIDYDKVISQTLKEASKKGLIEWMKS